MTIELRNKVMLRNIALTSSELLKQGEYWQSRLCSAPLMPSLSEIVPRRGESKRRQERVEYSIRVPETIRARLIELSNKSEGNLKISLIALVMLLLFKCFGQHEILIGVPLSLEGTCQPFGLMNLVILRATLTATMSFKEFLLQLKETVAAANENSTYPYEALRKTFGIEQSLDGDPFARIVVSFGDDANEESLLQSIGCEIVFAWTIQHDSIQLSLCTYSAIGKAGLRRLVDFIIRVAETTVEDIKRPLAEVDILPASEYLFLQPSNDIKTYYQAPLVHDLFQMHARSKPFAEAVVFGDIRLSFAELESSANRLANLLLDLGLGPGKLVGLLLERSHYAVISVLAAFKAGVAYVPLDKDYPVERMAFIMRDSGLDVLITQRHLRARIPSDFRGPVVMLDEVGIQGYPDISPMLNCSRHGAAYLIYTSGTSGQPKGVVVEHGAYAATCINYVSGYRLNEFEPVSLQLGALTFDVFNGDLGRSVLNGHKLVICPDAVRMDFSALHALIEREQISIFESTPAFINPFVEWMKTYKKCCSQLRVLISSADAWYTADYYRVRQYLPAEVKIFNTYGVTEAAIDSTYFEPRSLKIQSPLVPIGKPFNGIETYILGNDSQLMPIGLPGELYIGGVGLARGYLKRAALTAERFVPNPFSQQPGARMYRTGDLARYLPDGNIEFLGRTDYQVKIRGFRIELGEIEAALERHPAVRAAVAVAQEEPTGNKRLVAYVVSKGGSPLSTGQLRDFLRQGLPEYMLPSAFVQLEALPLNANGKVDRKALPAPESVRPELGQAYVAPRTPLETELAAIWSEVLGVEQVGVEDNFFDLGGHSLAAIRLVSRVRSLLPAVTLHAIYENQTIADLVRWSDKLNNATGL